MEYLIPICVIIVHLLHSNLMKHSTSLIGGI